jgi:hypothetical protein
MKTFIVRFTNLHKASKQAHTYVLAERFKCTDQHYIFLDGDENILSQHERKNVASVDDITDSNPPR